MLPNGGRVLERARPAQTCMRHHLSTAPVLSYISHQTAVYRYRQPPPPTAPVLPNRCQNDTRAGQQCHPPNEPLPAPMSSSALAEGDLDGDASRPRSGILTPSSEGSLNRRHGVASPSWLSNRRADAAAMDQLLKPSIAVKVWPVRFPQCSIRCAQR